MSTSIGVIHYNWPGYDLEGFARRASEIGYKTCELQIGDIWDEDEDDVGLLPFEHLDEVGIAGSDAVLVTDLLQGVRTLIADRAEVVAFAEF